MSKIKELEELLKNDVMIELKNNIEEVSKHVIKKKKDKDAKEELKNMKDLEEDFIDVLKDIENGDMSEEEAHEIIEELDNLRVDEGDL